MTDPRHQQVSGKFIFWTFTFLALFVAGALLVVAGYKAIGLSLIAIPVAYHIWDVIQTRTEVSHDVSDLLKEADERREESLGGKLWNRRGYFLGAFFVGGLAYALLKDYGLGS